MSALHFDESLVRIFDEDALDTYAVEEELAGALYAGGWVKETYATALHEREEAFPTALDAQGINVAIPHCETEHVNQGAIAVGVLKHPVAWRRMDDSSQTCDVSLVVMLALVEAHAHLEMLQKVIAIVQDQEFVGMVIAQDEPQEVYRLLSDRLL
ncbi:PTS sugar transporter subunit IIA [Enorma massiliensis]|uniref:PTS sugar transporter subunit IIA n=1 Tax=Enorma massiliensis TaxID=1472761 RepID=UPI0034A2D6F2